MENKSDQAPVSETPRTQTPPISQLSTPPTVNPLKPAGKFSIKAIVSTIIFLLLAGGAAAAFVYREPIIALVSKPTPTPSPTEVSTKVDDPTADWKTYTNSSGRYTVNYPSDYKINVGESIGVDGVITKKPDTYVQVISPAIAKANGNFVIDIDSAETTYNTVGEYIDAKLWCMDIKSSNGTPFTLGGTTGLIYEQTSCGPRGSTNIYVINNGRIYSISIEATADYKVIKPIYNQILSTFTFNKLSASKFTDIESSKSQIICNNDMAIRSVDEPFRKIEGSNSAGTITVAGTLTTKKQKIWNEEVSVVYIVVEKTSANTDFFDYYSQIAKDGNTVNLFEENKLFYKLGILKNNELVSTATISDATREKITTALKNEQSVKLNLMIPVWGGSGAPTDFSYACVISTN